MTAQEQNDTLLLELQEAAAEELAAGNVEVETATEQEVAAFVGAEFTDNVAGIRFVSLRGRVGAWDANQGNQRKTLSPVLHYNGPATGIPSGSDPVARLIGSARYHMQINWGGGARANGLQYQSACWGDIVYLCRNPLSRLWHAGNPPWNNGAHACHVPIGGNERGSAATLRTLKRWFDEINRTWGTKGARSHHELSSTSCPGTLHGDFVTKYRAGHNFGIGTPAPAPSPSPTPTPAPSPSPSPAPSPGKAIHRFHVTDTGQIMALSDPEGAKQAAADLTRLGVKFRVDPPLPK